MPYIYEQSICYAPATREFDTLHEAVTCAHYDVEWNEAYPVCLRAPDGRIIARGHEISGIYDASWYREELTLAQVRRQLQLQRRRGKAAAKRADAAYKRAENERHSAAYSMVGSEVTYQFTVPDSALQDEVMYRSGDPVGNPGDITYDRSGRVHEAETQRTAKVTGLQTKVDMVRSNGGFGAGAIQMHPLRHPHIMYLLENGDRVHTAEVERFKREGCIYEKVRRFDGGKATA